MVKWIHNYLSWLTNRIVWRSFLVWSCPQRYHLHHPGTLQVQSWYMEDGTTKHIRKGSLAWCSAKQGKQSNLHLCFMRWDRQEAKQAYLFSPVYKPKDQVIEQLDSQPQPALRACPGWLCLIPRRIDFVWVPSLTGWLQCSWKNIQYRGWRGGSAVKRTITFLEDLGSIPNLHVMAHNHL